jgi:hypothetical protein
MGFPPPFGTAHAFIPSGKGLTSMKSEQFHDLNLNHAETILETVGQLMKLAEKLFCTIRTALDNVSVDQEIAWAT